MSCTSPIWALAELVEAAARSGEPELAADALERLRAANAGGGNRVGARHRGALACAGERWRDRREPLPRGDRAARPLPRCARPRARPAALRRMVAPRTATPRCARAAATRARDVHGNGRQAFADRRRASCWPQARRRASVYAVYDAVQCPQQKCLIHFIRDLNDELLKHPYDDELKQLVGEFAGLVKPIMRRWTGAVTNKRFLGKHRIFVVDSTSVSTANSVPAKREKNRPRFQKNRNTMFTFLDFDDVPWNNNNAEHAIKAFAVVRRVSKEQPQRRAFAIL